MYVQSCVYMYVCDPEFFFDDDDVPCMSCKPTKGEVRDAMQLLKHRKPPGGDDITAELLERGG